MTDRNALRCTFCGAEIYTEAQDRYCYKCESTMIFIGKESKFKRVIK